MELNTLDAVCLMEHTLHKMRYITHFKNSVGVGSQRYIVSMIVDI